MVELFQETRGLWPVASEREEGGKETVGKQGRTRRMAEGVCLNSNLISLIRWPLIHLFKEYLLGANCFPGAGDMILSKTH